MEASQSRAQLQDDFLFKLNIYSRCIQPYLRNIQEKYVASYYYVDSEKLDFNAYCKKELELVSQAKSSLERTMGTQE
eukprot:403330896